MADTTNRYERRKVGDTRVESELESLLEDAREAVLNDPALPFNAPPALTLDMYVARVIAEKKVLVERMLRGES